MSDNTPATAEANNNACCGTIVGVGAFLFNVSLILLWRGGATEAASMLFLVGACIFVLFLVVGIIGGIGESRRQKKMEQEMLGEYWHEDR